MRNVTVVLDSTGRQVAEGRILSSQIGGITLAADGNLIRDYRAADGYTLIFGGPLDQVNDAREYGGFVMRMIEQRRWNRAASIDEL